MSNYQLLSKNTLSGFHYKRKKKTLHEDHSVRTFVT
jgi:hypothetical protein